MGSLSSPRMLGEGTSLSEAAHDLQKLITETEPLLIKYLIAGDDLRGESEIAKPCHPSKLAKSLNFDLPAIGEGLDGFKRRTQQILDSSVHTWHQGSLSKLYSAPSVVGVVAELILAVLNTNVHVYEMSPALTVIEKKVAASLAALFGLSGPYAGGFTQSGGSACNLTALVVARNSLFPDIKTDGYRGKKLVLFTSAHGHYSFEKAAQVIGLGSKAAWSVPTDSYGRMLPDELLKLVKQARDEGCIPFFVNATAGTTVLGSYDPFEEIAAVCKREKMWFHIDGSWGGPVIFSAKHGSKLRGCSQADSIAFNPHKMLNAPLTCSFILAGDLRNFWRSNTLPAGYLFHEDDAVDAAETAGEADEEESDRFWDIADLTLQCGRRGDALKFALDWQFHGSLWYESRIDNAFQVAQYLSKAIEEQSQLKLITPNPPTCLQVCWAWAPEDGWKSAEETTQMTRFLAKELVKRNFMVDHAPGAQGMFLRAVINLNTNVATIDHLVRAVLDIGTRSK